MAFRTQGLLYFVGGSELFLSSSSLCLTVNTCISKRFSYYNMNEKSHLSHMHFEMVVTLLFHIIIELQAQDHILRSSLESSIDKSPYVNVMEDGMIAPVTDDGPCDDITPSHQVNDIKQDNGDFTQQNEHTREVDDKNITEVNAMPSQSPEQSAGQQVEEHYVGKFHEAIAPVKRSINQLTRYQGKSVWLLAYIAFVTSWPLLGSLAFIAFRKKFRNNLLAKWLRR